MKQKKAMELITIAIKNLRHVSIDYDFTNIEKKLSFDPESELNKVNFKLETLHYYIKRDTK